MQIGSIPNAQETQSRCRLHLLYHELRPVQSEYSYAVSVTDFERHLDLIRVIRDSESACLWPELTFDDGHLSDFNYALPNLQSRSLVARFFITVGWTDNKSGYMGWRELRSLHQSGQMIGSHGWSHALLTHCTKKDLDRELLRSRLLLEDKLGTSITSMSLPGGRHNGRVLAACREAGYTQVFTSQPKAESATPGFTIGRLNVRGDMTIDWIQHLFEPESSTLASLQRQYKVKVAAQRFLGDDLYDKVWSVLNRKEPLVANSRRNAE